MIVALAACALVVVIASMTTGGSPAATHDVARSADAETPTPVVTGSPTIPPPPGVIVADGTTYRDFAFDTDLVSVPTANKAQSKVWWADATWWAAMVQPLTNRVNIFRLDPVTQVWRDTGTLLDERRFADPDVLSTGDHLYVVSGGFRPTASHALRYLRFSYDDTIDRYQLDPNFPITITDGGTAPAVIALDGSGVVWVTFAVDGRIWLTHTVGNDAQWVDPLALPLDHTSVSDDDLATIVAFGPGKIGIMWSNQLEDSVYFSEHDDGAPDFAWSSPEVIINGVASADGHLNAKSYDLGHDEGRGVVVTLKTSHDDRDNANPLDPLILLGVRDGSSGWATYLVGQVRDHHTRAVVLVDDVARRFYVAATSPTRGGVIYYKGTSIDRVSFDTGLGVPLVASQADPSINDVSASKQPVSRESGLLVLASDGTTGRYLHSIVDIGGGLPLANPSDPDRPDAPGPPDPATTTIYFRSEFEPWPSGPAAELGTGWSVRPEDPPEAIAIVADDAGGRVLRIAPANNGGAVRACRAFPDTAGGLLTVAVRIRISSIGDADTPILSIRGTGGEVATIRITSSGRFAWFDGRNKIVSRTAARPSNWYRVSVVIDGTARTYDATISADDESESLSGVGLNWRGSTAASSRSVCVETAGGSRVQHVEIAEAVVLHRAGS